MTSLPIFLRPRVDAVEVDLTQRAKLFLSTTAAVVGEFERGSTSPVFDNGPTENFLIKYGRKANPQKYGFAHDTIKTFRRESTNTLVIRAVGAGALYSGATLIKVDDRIIDLPFVNGSAGGYLAKDAQSIQVLKFSAALIAANTFTVSVTDGVTLASLSAVTFNTDNDTTLNNIAIAIQNLINTNFGVSNAVVTVHNELQNNKTSNRLIVIRMPSTLSLTFSSPLVANGTSQATVSILDNPTLADIYVENPGDWGKLYGYKITNFDKGIRQRIRLTFSQALITGNTFNMDINGVAIDPVAFSSTSDAMMTAIAAEIAQNADVVSATVESAPGADNNDRSIVIVSQLAGPDKLTITNPIVTGGASQAVALVQEVLKGIVPEHIFTLEVFEKSNTAKPVETFKVSFQERSNALGFQYNIEQVINKNSKSLIIRVVQSAATKVENFSLLTATDEAPTVKENVTFFTGGDDGVAVTSADIRNAWDKIQDRTLYPVNLLLNAGYSIVSVMQHMTYLAEKRSDCTAILDCPFDKLAAEDFRNFRLNDLNIDNSFGALYGPYVEIDDTETGAKRLIPPSGPIGAVYASNDRITKQMGSPFGLNRGKVKYITGLSHYYNEGEQELLHPNQCNFIIDRPGNGPVVMSERTLLYKPSILQAVHARRILNILKTGLVDSLEYIIGDNNTKGTRYRALALGDTILKPVKKGGGLYYYAQQCSEVNNTKEVIDAEILAYDAYLQIVRNIRGVALRTILLPTGIKMEEVADVDGF